MFFNGRFIYEWNPDGANNSKIICALLWMNVIIIRAQQVWNTSETLLILWFNTCTVFNSNNFNAYYINALPKCQYFVSKLIQVCKHLYVMQKKIFFRFITCPYVNIIHISICPNIQKCLYIRNTLYRWILSLEVCGKLSLS